MDNGRLQWLICVSETVVYSQINWFREQINRSLRMKMLSNTSTQMIILIESQYDV